jgi:hypothetical protein
MSVISPFQRSTTNELNPRAKTTGVLRMRKKRKEPKRRMVMRVPYRF